MRQRRGVHTARDNMHQTDTIRRQLGIEDGAGDLGLLRRVPEAELAVAVGAENVDIEAFGRGVCENGLFLFNQVFFSLLVSPT